MTYAVAAMNFYDNELKVELVEADNWKEAISKHTIFKEQPTDKTGDVSWLPDNIKEAKDEAFGADIVFDVIEIP